MAKIKKLSVSGDRRKTKVVKRGTKIPVLRSGMQENAQILAQSNYQEIIGLIEHVNKVILPAIHSLELKMESAVRGIKDLESKLNGHNSFIGENNEYPKFNLDIEDESGDSE